MSRSGWAFRGLLAGLAAVGVVVAHAIAYLIAVPDPSLRNALLFVTGHEGWSLVIAVAAGVLTFGLSGFVLSEAAEGGPKARPSIWSIALRLAGMQTIGFVVLEASERLLAGSGLETLWSEPVLTIGLLLQLVVALIGAVVLVGFVWAVETLLGKRTPLTGVAARPAPLPLFETFIPRIRISADSATPRGPPVTN
jgi:hypothetical protein